MFLYHGSRTIVKEPDISYSRNDIDFGSGFYFTEDETMAKKWACNKTTSFLNIYEADLSNLYVYEFKADREWLDFCKANRYQEKTNFPTNAYHVLIGPTADDRLFNTLDMYSDGLLSADCTIEVVNCMKISKQIVFVNQKALNEAVRFVDAKELTKGEKQHYTELFRADLVEKNRRADEIIRKFNSR